MNVTTKIAGTTGADEIIPALQASIAECAARPLPLAVTLPPAAYTSEAWFKYEAETVMKPGWMCVAHVSQIKSPGDYVRIDLLDEPMLVIRGEDGEVRVLSRVCPHRGADIMPYTMGYTDTGSAKSLVCPYHRWSFSFDGGLKGCAHMEQAAEFNKADWGLAKIRTEIFEGFVLVNLSGDAPPASEYYADLKQLLAPWNAAEMELCVEMEWDCHFNWKIMVENWMEAYHHMGSHKTTLNTVMPAETTWVDRAGENLVRVHLPLTPELAAQVADSMATGAKLPGFEPYSNLPLERQQEWEVFTGLPHFMLLTARDRLLWYRLIPISAGECKLLTTTLVSRESKAAPDFAATVEAEAKMLREFHVEDMEVNTAVQVGMHSQFALQGRLSHMEEPLLQIQAWLARNVNAVPNPAGP
jgi:phenylpropionate dioxygenase-like ring-hydroxylating dioxygenase large terminal subunit